MDEGVELVTADVTAGPECVAPLWTCRMAFQVVIAGLTLANAVP